MKENNKKQIVARCYNEFCVKCLDCDIQMIKIGPFAMCNNCFREELHDITTEDGIDTNNPVYIIWLEEHKKVTKLRQGV